MARILLTAFEPFGGAEINASRAVAERLASETDRWELLILPVVAGEAERRLIARLEAGPLPDCIISLGEADATPHVRLEKVAVNWDDFRIPDNAGNQPLDAPIHEDGPAAYFATLPISEIERQLDGQTPLPVIVSLTAGAFVCNHLSYAMLHWLVARPEPVPYLFIHVPRWRITEVTYTLDDLVLSVGKVLEHILFLLR